MVLGATSMPSLTIAGLCIDAMHDVSLRSIVRISNKPDDAGDNSSDLGSRRQPLGRWRGCRSPQRTPIMMLELSRTAVGAGSAALDVDGAADMQVRKVAASCPH